MRNPPIAKSEYCKEVVTFSGFIDFSYISSVVLASSFIVSLSQNIGIGIACSVSVIKSSCSFGVSKKLTVTLVFHSKMTTCGQNYVSSVLLIGQFRAFYLERAVFTLQFLAILAKKRVNTKTEGLKAFSIVDNRSGSWLIDYIRNVLDVVWFKSIQNFEEKVRAREEMWR